MPPDDTRPTRDLPGVIAPPPLIYLGGLALGFLLEAVLPGGSLPSAIQWGLGGGLLLAGVGLAGWWASSFRRADTPLPPYAPTTALVTDGPYRLTRNPGYLSFALVFAAIALLADAPWALLPLPLVLAVIQSGVIVREERYLERLFGQDYRDLKARTRRWV
jgi:protein-S-isoprenylcysteine O-methyltransferase Ste14